MQKRKALITRPLHDAEKLAHELAIYNIKTFIEPMFEIIFPEKYKMEVCNKLQHEKYQAILITSANAVRALAKATPTRDYKLFTVGYSSAKEATQVGFENVISANGDVYNLAELIGKQCQPEHGKFLHITGTVVAGDLQGELAKNGFSTERCVTYEAVAADKFSKEVREIIINGEIGSVLFYSPRTANIFCKLIKKYSLERYLQEIYALCLSSAVKKALEGTLWGENYTASSPDNEAMLALISRVYDTGRVYNTN